MKHKRLGNIKWPVSNVDKSLQWIQETFGEPSDCDISMWELIIPEPLQCYHSQSAYVLCGGSQFTHGRPWFTLQTPVILKSRWGNWQSLKWASSACSNSALKGIDIKSISLKWQSCSPYSVCFGAWLQILFAWNIPDLCLHECTMCRHLPMFVRSLVIDELLMLMKKSIQRIFASFGLQC